MGMLLTAGCTGANTSQANAPTTAPAGIEKTTERGPVKMTVRTDKSEITIAERLELSIEVTAPQGVEVEMPSFGMQLNEFQIRDFRDEPARAVDGGLQWRQTYDLDIFLSGEYSIPAITATFVDRRNAEAAPDKPTATADESPTDAGHSDEPPAPQAQPADPPGTIRGEIASDPFTIKVTSLLAGDFDPTKFRDLKAPVALPPEPVRLRAWWFVPGAAVVVGLGLGAWFMLRRRRIALARAIPPHEWAFDQLRLLIDEKLVELGQIHEFYFRLSLIVREYIERRFGLMAPERTTEEFLVEMRRSPVLSDEHKRLLGEFLTACDMVKFACYTPQAKEIEQAFDAARDFVEQTIPHESSAVSQRESEIGNRKSEIKAA